MWSISFSAREAPQQDRAVRRSKLHHSPTDNFSRSLELFDVGIELAHAVELRDELDGKVQHPGYALDNEERDPQIEALDPASKAE